jgi:hypothetical protein
MERMYQRQRKYKIKKKNVPNTTEVQNKEKECTKDNGSISIYEKKVPKTTEV